MEPGGSEPGGFNSTGGQDFGYVSDFGFDHDHHDGHGDHGHGDHGDHGHGDHFGDDHMGGDHDEDHDHDHDGEHANHHHSGLKGLIARLLGLDKDANMGGADHGHGEHGHGHGHGQQGQTPSQSAMYANALAGISLSEAFQGIRVTPNFLYLCLFAGFTLWLFVVYWIRHNEPLANQVLGTAAANTRSTVDDRRLLNSVKDAMPFRTSSNFGEIYTPNAPYVPPVQAIDQQLMYKAGNARPMPEQHSTSAVPQTLQQKLLSTAAQQPYEMSAQTAQFANQYVNQAVATATQSRGYGAPSQGMYPSGNGTAGSFYAMPAQPQPMYSYPPTQMMAPPQGMTAAPSQFGTAAPMMNAGPARFKTVINR